MILIPHVGHGGVDGEKTLNFCPIYGAKYRFHGTNPLPFPHLSQVGEVGHTIDRCINVLLLLY